MLTKLAFKNVGKSFKDYAIYFFTLVFGVCVFYMFNSINAQEGIMEVTKTTHAAMQSLSKILGYISVFVSIVLGFLIVYANNFFIKRRKKELGIYLTLGMDKLKISAILVMETSLIAMLALVFGLISGVFLSQFMSVFTARIFEADLSSYKFVFSPEAVVKSILYFGIIFLIVIIFNTVAISKYRLIDLIYGGRKNENLKLKNIFVSFILFILSLICLGAAYALIIKNGMIDLNIYFTSSILLGTIGTVLFFFSLTGFVINLIQKNKKLYYKNLNMFVLRQLNSKINTNFISMAVVCIVLLLTIGIFSSGFSMQNVLSESLTKSVPFDVTFFGSAEDDNNSIIKNLPHDLKTDEFIKEYDEYIEYVKTGLKYGDILKISSDANEYMLSMHVKFITLTDYNELLALQGKNKFDLKENSYAVIVNHEMLIPYADNIISSNAMIEIEDDKLYPMKEKLDTVTKNQMDAIMLVIEDKYVSNMKKSDIIANVNCFDEESIMKFDDKMKEYQKSIHYENWPYYYYATKTHIYESSVTTKAVVSFLAIYLGFVFLIASAAILALQQLSEAADNKERYELLSKLGADKKMINNALFTQIACYFILPLSLASVHSIVGLSVANNVIKAFGQVDIWGSIIATAAFIVLIYGAYFITTYMGSKNIVNK